MPYKIFSKVIETVGNKTKQDIFSELEEEINAWKRENDPKIVREHVTSSSIKSGSSHSINSLFTITIYYLLG